MDEFDEHYLYQTALYNGLTDTIYADTVCLKVTLKLMKINLLGEETSGQKKLTKN